MNGATRRKYARLLHWYPKVWRDEHGRLMLDTLEEHAADRAVARPSVAEAWSIRAHGLGERATNRWAVIAATFSLVVFIAATAILLSDAMMFPGAGALRIALAVFMGPLALAVAGVILLHRRGQLSAPASLCAVAGAGPAFAMTALAAASWSLGFDEADAGGTRTWFGSATFLFILMGWFFGTVSLLAPVASVVKRRLPSLIRLLLIGTLAALLAIVTGIMVVTGQILGGLGAAVVLLMALLAGRPAPPSERPEVEQVIKQAVRPDSPAVLTRSSYTKICRAALLALVVGIGCAAFALTGSLWVPGVRDSSHAMNLGLAAGALAAMLVVIALAMVLRPRFGTIMRWSALLLCAGLAMESAAQIAGAGHSLQWPLTLLAAVLAGFAVAVPIARFVSAKPPVRIAVAMALGLAAAMPGIMIVTAAAFIAPVAAVALAVWSWRRLSAGRRAAGPQLASIQ
ncbi:hypothetical protein [Arthrobacter sp. N199823]|uniref:hypothetical protein n=1 Tax=Arthrobacter sp. N199823 TaxID=2058895 RepID=UPI000CE2EBF9|nr:hypothetical protein [Arthrobacter sp. N199823]